MKERGFCLVAAVFLMFAAGTAQAAAEEKCQLMEAAELDMSTDLSGRVNVPMTVGGQNIKLMIDTAGFVSTLTRYTVKSLGLPSESAFRPLETYYGGEVVDHFVTAHDVMLGHLRASSLIFFVMSNYRTSADVGGTLAPNVLRNYDADFDFEKGVFRLFSKDHCEGKVVYWTTGGFGQVSFRLDNSGHIVVPVLLDGKEVRAAIDTGSADTVASFDRIEDKLNLDEKSPGMTLIPGRPADRPRYRYPFKTLTFDDVTVSNPDITLVPDKQSKMGGSDETIVLGMNVLRRLHIYIAYGEEKLYVTPATAR
jgi:predicted aspartyl protease